MGGSSGGGDGPDPPGKSQAAIGVLRNSGTYPHQKAIRPKGSDPLMAFRMLSM